ncbi:hypothetical protein GF376_03525 [Candidatus Peregrinibacteria bacterium]|nr:hypothetical protein [Candidatus Peregrinibacteria bacterium]
MADLESFISIDNNEQGFDAESFKAFQERMSEASKQIQASRKQEKKQKKQEEKLIAILLKFIRENKNKDLIELVSKLLAENLPAQIIVSLLLISEKELQKETGILIEGKSHSGGNKQNTLPDLYFKSQVLPLEVKLKIEEWIAEINNAFEENKQKFNQRNYTKVTIVKTAALSFSQYLEKASINHDFNKILHFTDMFMSGIISNTSYKYLNTNE